MTYSDPLAPHTVATSQIPLSYPNYLSPTTAEPIATSVVSENPLFSNIRKSFRKYLDFSGRATRTEFWTFQIFLILVPLLFGLIFILPLGLLGNWILPSWRYGSFSSVLGVVIISLLSLFWLATLLPRVSLIVRRLHDQNKTGWMALLHFVPIVGPIILLVLMCLEGTRGSNSYGPDPHFSNF